MSLDLTRLPKGAYVFDLHLLCGGYAYFSTLTGWNGFGDHGREFRQPVLANVANFIKALELIGQPHFLIRDQSDYEYWLAHRGWAIVSEEVARSAMPQWLKNQLCLKSAANTFTDVNLCSPNALNHSASRGKRAFVIDRDGGRCLLCGASVEDGIRLTMQHIRPFSTGGETTTRNLVAFCESCNQSLGAEQFGALYQLAGLPHGVDLGLFRAERTPEAIRCAVEISDNLMHTRCEVW